MLSWAPDERHIARTQGDAKVLADVGTVSREPCMPLKGKHLHHGDVGNFEPSESPASVGRIRQIGSASHTTKPKETILIGPSLEPARSHQALLVLLKIG